MMILSLFGPQSDVALLRGGLDETSATQRTIAARVASATSSSANGDFASQLNGHKPGAGSSPSEADLQQDMAALADTELRYESCAKLLQTAYANLRQAMQTSSG
jgi:hypothetical protein